MLRIGGWSIPWTVVPGIAFAGALMFLLARLVRTRRGALVLALIPVLAGIALGIATIREPSGYVAAYGFGAAWVLAVGLGIVGILMVAPEKLRRGGIFSLTSAVLLLVGFYFTVFAGKALGLTSWKGPDG
jgi:hypothetical protein